MAGYTRQSAAQIISGEVISASPLNAEYNQLLNAFDDSTGHKHDGTTAEGPPIDRVADVDQKNKVLIDTNNNEIEFYVEQSGATEQQLSIKHEIIEPTVDNNINLGSGTKAFKNIHAKGTTNLANVVVTGTLNLAGISSSSGTLELGSAVNIDGGSIDGTPIGSNSASTISGTTITATTKFVGPIEGAVTGNVTGDVGGNLTGSVTGNVTASSGSSTFNDVIINGGLNMDAASAATITNLTAPSSDLDAATKKYVDDEIVSLIDGAPAALNTLNEIAASLADNADLSGTLTTSIAQKLPKAGGTMTGNITMSNSSKVTGLPNPSANSDVANKAYVDTMLPLAGGTLTGALTLPGSPTNNLHAATKAYVDTTMGSNNAAQTSATAAANSASDAQKLAIQAENSQYTLSDGSTTGFSALHHAAKAEDSATAAANSFDSFDDIYLGAKSSSPSVDNDGDALATGALYFDTTAGNMFVFNGSSFVVTGSAVNGTSSRQVYTATANQTTFAVSHDIGFVDVYLNGLKLRTGTDFTDNNVNNIVLASGATVGDIVDIVAYGAFNVASHYTQTQSDARYTRTANNLSELTATASTARSNIGASPTANPTFTGTVTIPTDGLNYAGTVVTASGAEINKLEGATASTAELNHVTGVTSAIQTQLNAKASTTDLATTNTAVGTKAPLASPNFSGTPQVGGSNILTSATAPASGGTADFVAQGNLTNGMAVGLRADGKVEPIVGVNLGDGTSTASTFAVSNSVHRCFSTCYDSTNDKTIIVYVDDVNVKAAVCTVTDNVLTFGTPVTIHSGGAALDTQTSVCHDPNVDRLLFVYSVASDNVTYLKVGQLSGVGLNSITLGSSTNLTAKASTVSPITTVFQKERPGPADVNVIVVAFATNSHNYLAISAITITGGSTNTAAFSTITDVTSASTADADLAYFASDQRVVATYVKPGDTYNLQARAFAWFGSSWSFGTETAIDNGYWTESQVTFDPQGNDSRGFVFARESLNNGYSSCWAVRCAGGSISAGSPVVVNSGDNGTYLGAATNGKNQAVLFYLVGSTVKSVFVSRSSATITAATPASFQSFGGTHNITIYDPDAKTFISVSRNPSDGILTAKTYAEAGSNNTSFIGISDAVTSNGATGAVKVFSGIKTGLSSLTPNKVYYVNATGVINDTATGTIAPVKIGRALSTSSLQITEAHT